MNNKDYCRLGIMIGKKSGNAVERNRIKRIIREVFRHQHVRYGGRYDFVITQYAKMKEKSKKEIAGIIETLFNLVEKQGTTL